MVLEVAGEALDAGDDGPHVGVGDQQDRGNQQGPLQFVPHLQQPTLVHDNGLTDGDERER